MAELTIHLDLSFGTRSLRCLMAGAMIFSAVSEVASESVTLTTYYPAPSGVYTQMITTGNTYLARDAGVCPGSSCGTRVGIGTPTPSAQLTIVNTDNSAGDILQVYPRNLTQGIGIGYDYIQEIGSNGNNTMYIDAQGSGNLILSTKGTGLVGVGTAAPEGQLTVTSRGAGTVAFVVHGAKGDDWFPYSDGYNYIRGPTIMADTGGNVGIGTPGAASQRLEVNGDTKADQTIVTDGTCHEVQFAIDGYTDCATALAAAGFPWPASGAYATTISGVISVTTEMPLYSETTFGSTAGGEAPMLCCACPASGCPL